MKKFQVGKRVVDPIHGAGIITEISMQRISGQMIECVVIDIVAGKKRVIVPVENMQDTELRPMATEKEIQDTLDELVSEPKELPKDWRRRIEKLKEKVHSGEPMQIAQAIRDILARAESKKMNPSEKRVLNEALTLLAGEISVVREVDCNWAKKMIKQLCSDSVHRIDEETVDEKEEKAKVEVEQSTGKKKTEEKKETAKPGTKYAAKKKATEKPKPKTPVKKKAATKPKKKAPGKKKATTKPKRKS